VEYGLAQRHRRPLHVLGIDEVSRRKGHRYLTVVYDLERGVLLWVGEDRTEATLTRFFAQLGRAGFMLTRPYDIPRRELDLLCRKRFRGFLTTSNG
jgi:hypothetical protein